MKLFKSFEHPEMVERGVQKLRDFRTGERTLNSEELAGIREEQRARSEDKTPPAPVETNPPRRSDNSMAAFDEWQRKQEAEEEERQERWGHQQ